MIEQQYQIHVPQPGLIEQGLSPEEAIAFQVKMLTLNKDVIEAEDIQGTEVFAFTDGENDSEVILFSTSFHMTKKIKG